jgi:hypothetical protein
VRFASFSGSIHLVLESVFSLVAFFLAVAGFTVVTKVGGNAMGPAVSNVVAAGVFALGHKRLG